MYQLAIEMIITTQNVKSIPHTINEVIPAVRSIFPHISLFRHLGGGCTQARKEDIKCQYSLNRGMVR